MARAKGPFVLQKLLENDLMRARVDLLMSVHLCFCRTKPTSLSFTFPAVSVLTEQAFIRDKADYTGEAPCSAPAVPRQVRHHLHPRLALRLLRKNALKETLSLVLYDPKLAVRRREWKLGVCWHCDRSVAEGQRQDCVL